ncbi:MAG: hypothetical protein PHI01_01445 [Candidatus Izemoplasmatales bacterium]|jgi:hypothetical protein|nr:hypothetical protein [Candidatus Izemoplasmatales bacterium]
MKTKWIFAIITVIIICLGGIITYLSLLTRSFTAVISHIGDDYIIVEAGNNDRYSGRFSLSIDVDTIIVDDSGNQLLLSDLSVGNTVIVYFSGSIQESDPAKISKCKKIILSST